MNERRLPSKDIRHAQLIPLVVLLLITFVLHLTGIDRESLWRDEVDSIRFAADIWDQVSGGETIKGMVSELTSYLTRPGWNGPLYFLALEPWLQAAGQSELALRIPSTLAGLIAVAVSYQLGSHLFGSVTGQLSALFFAVNPYLAWYAGEGKMYTLITALSLLSTFLLLKACRSGLTRLWLAYLLITSLLFYTHILTPLLLPVQASLVLLLEPRAALSRRALLSAGLLVLPYLPLLIWQWPHLAEKAETGFPFVPLPAMGMRMGEVISRGVVGWTAKLPLTLLLGAMGLGLSLSPASLNRRWARLRAGLGLVIWAGLPIVELYLVSLRRPLFTERYLIWILPAWLILAAGGLAGLAQRGRIARLVALGWTAGLVVVGLLGTSRQWGTPLRADFRSAAALLTDHYQPDELIVFQIPYLQDTFDYYAPELSYTAAEGPYTNWGNPAEETDTYLRATTAGYSAVWLVLSEAPMWDARGLTVAWFRDNAQLQSEVTFNRVEVTEWQLGEGP